MRYYDIIFKKKLKVTKGNRKIPDILRIMLYDSKEKLSYGDCYLEITVRKE